jgi:two-component system, OmpR family, response regulator
MDASSPPRVLIVDDEAEYVQTLAKVLRRRGLQVEVAGDGPAALATLDRCTVDVALLDVKMPHMDGTQLLVELRRRWPQLPVILMTGHLQEGGDEDLRRAAFAFLLKPHPIPELLELIARATACARGSQPCGAPRLPSPD